MVINQELYQGMLPHPDFLIIPSKKNYQEWTTSFDGVITIKITYGSLIKNMQPSIFLEQLLHQMVHIYCHIFDIKDTTRQGRYHNANFRRVARDYGLKVKPESHEGTHIIGCQDQVYKIIKQHISEFDREICCIEKYLRNQTDQTYTYVCPICNRKVKGEQGTKLICGYCYTEMITM